MIEYLNEYFNITKIDWEYNKGTKNIISNMLSKLNSKQNKLTIKDKIKLKRGQ